MAYCKMKRSSLDKNDRTRFFVPKKGMKEPGLLENEMLVSVQRDAYKTLLEIISNIFAKSYVWFPLTFLIILRRPGYGIEYFKMSIG